MKSSKLRYGFKSEANELARTMRRELGLKPHERLDPWRLAEFLEIPIMRLSEFASEIPDEVHHLMEVEGGAFSAATIFSGRKRLIVHNDAHSIGRQSNNISHELSHALLQHEPAPAFSIVGCRDWNDVMEEEASFLGAAILISEEAAVHIVRSEMGIQEAADHYVVSRQLVQMRINLSGAVRRAKLRSPRKVERENKAGVRRRGQQSA